MLVLAALAASYEAAVARRRLRDGLRHVRYPAAAAAAAAAGDGGSMSAPAAAPAQLFNEDCPICLERRARPLPSPNDITSCNMI